MFYSGHLGTTLACYAWVLVAIAASDPLLAGFSTAWALAWGLASDIDSYVDFLEHRGPTHSFTFGLAGAILGALIGFPFGVTVATVLSIGAFLGVVSHLLADVLNPMGIRPWWPLSDREHTLNTCKAGDREMNRVLLGFGVSSAVFGSLLSYAFALP